MTKKKKVRGVLSGDWHFCNRLPMAVDTFAGVTDRLQHVQSVFKQMIDDAVEYESDFIGLLGDIFDKSRPDPLALKMVFELVVDAANRGLKVLVLPGNHDGDLRGAYFFATEALGSIQHENVVHLELGKPYALAPWLEVHGIPYAPLAGTIETLKDLADDPPREGVQRIGFLHQAIVGATHYGYTVPEEHGVPGHVACDPFEFAFAGHFHRHQTFGDDWGMYLGAPLQHSFGDVGDEMRGWWRVEFTKGADPDLKHVRSRDVPRFRSARVNLSDPMAALILLAADGPLRKGDYVRLDYQATHAEKGSALATMGPAVEKLRDAGVNVDLRHIPVAHHAGRLDVDEETPAESRRAFVGRATASYLDGPANVGELNVERLRAIATEVLDSVFDEGVTSC